MTITIEIIVLNIIMHKITKIVIHFNPRKSISQNVVIRLLNQPLSLIILYYCVKKIS